ncbi:MAG: polysaccharide deacetylase [Lachnospiraceae bacterium]|nr:polysaccharide deacetylase [Lachnospiraceae bacterium]
MSTRNETLTKNKKRRARVTRIKVGIILTLFLWMIISVVSIVYLFVKVHNMQLQLDYLMEHFTVSESGEDIGEISEEADTEVSYNTDIDESIEEDYPIANAVGFSDNLASEGDTLKAYLTFDDGPSNNTAEILDILKEYDVKATFFVIGQEDEQSKALYQRIVDEGHTLAMHSYSHKYSELYSSVEAFEEDFSKIQNLLYDVTGEECLYYRFPGGSSNQVNNDDMAECISFLNSQGITYFDWNVSNGDATSQVYTSEELVENVMKDVVKYKTSIVLMHDTSEKEKTVQSLRTLIERLKAENIEILPIDENTTVIQHIAANSVE